MARASQQQTQIFVETFYAEWGQKFLRNRTDYFDSVNTADLAAGLAPGTVPPGSIPSFDQLTGGSATRTSGGATSTGTIVAESQTAQNSGANPQNPPNVPLAIPNLAATPQSSQLLANLTARVNAEVNALAQTVLPGSQSQAVAPGSVNIGLQRLVPPSLIRIATDATRDDANAGSVTGAGSGIGGQLPVQVSSAGTVPGAFKTDDASRSDSEPTKESLRQQIDQLYGSSTLIPNQRNVLTEYENFTYQLNWYIAPPSTYNKFTNYRNLSNYFLLAQSGGAAGTAGSVQSNQVDATGGVQTAPVDFVSSASRNPFFDVDFYIDNMEVVTRFPLAGTRLSHSNSEISFTVTEPYGISLVPRLQNAIEDVYKQAGIFTSSGARYASAVYLMVIKYWGINAAGNLERVVTKTANGTPIGPVEKYIPFVIRELRFTQGSRFVEYRIVGNPPFTYIGLGRERGVLLDRVTLTGRTVKDILAGQTVATGTATADTAAEGRTSTSSVETTPESTVNTVTT